MFKKSAFTMIELVLVIVILGIIASIGAQIIVKLYDNYITTRAINRLQAQSELVLNEIAQRLQFRIKDSVIARQKGTANFLNYVPLTDANDSYQVLEWIGKDNDSFRGVKNPGWSGFIDLDNNDTNKAFGTLKTSGSELNISNVIIKALSFDQTTGDSKVSLDTTAPFRPAIIFKGQSNFDISQYGWNGVEGNYTHRVKMQGNDILKFVDANTTYPNEIYEQYDFAWSAYAIVPEGNNANDFNLTIHYNYQPWENERYDQNATTSVLVEHVSTFKFTKIGDTIRLKLCLNDAFQSGDYNFAFCKEKVVY